MFENKPILQNASWCRPTHANQPIYEHTPRTIGGPRMLTQRNSPTTPTHYTTVVEFCVSRRYHPGGICRSVCLVGFPFLFIVLRTPRDILAPFCDYVVAVVFVCCCCWIFVFVFVTVLLLLLRMLTLLGLLLLPNFSKLPYSVLFFCVCSGRGGGGGSQGFRGYVVKFTLYYDIEQCLADR